MKLGKMFDTRGLLIGICLIVVTFAYSPFMFQRALRLPLRQYRSVMQMSSIRPEQAITLVDFRLPAKDTEVIQNLVNDEIISTSVIGTR